MRTRIIIVIALALLFSIIVGFAGTARSEEPGVLEQPVIESDIHEQETPHIIDMNSIENRENVENYVLVIRVHGEEAVGYLSVKFESAGDEYCYFTWSNKVVMQSHEGQVAQHGLYHFLIPESQLVGVNKLVFVFRLEPPPVSQEEAKAQVTEQRKYLCDDAIFQMSMTRWPGMLEGEWLPLPVPPDEGESIEFLFGVEGTDMDFVFHRQTSQADAGPDAERHELPSISGNADETVFWRIDPAKMGDLVCWVTAEEHAITEQSDEIDED